MDTAAPLKIRVRTEVGLFSWRVRVFAVEGGFAAASDGVSAPTATDPVHTTPEAAALAMIQAFHQRNEMNFGPLVTERID
mgnify:CR=1 FL=1